MSSSIRVNSPVRLSGMIALYFRTIIASLPRCSWIGNAATQVRIKGDIVSRCTAVKALVVGVLLASLTAPGLSHADAGRPPRDADAQPGRFLEEEYAERLGLEAETLAAIR